MPGHLGNVAPTRSFLSVWSVPLFFPNTTGQADYIILSSQQENKNGMWFCILVPTSEDSSAIVVMPNWMPSTQQLVPSNTPSTLCILVTAFLTSPVLPRPGSRAALAQGAYHSITVMTWSQTTTPQRMTTQLPTTSARVPLPEHRDLPLRG